MPMIIRCILLFVLTTVLSFGQVRREFEVASIRPAGEQPANQAAVGIHIDGSQVRIAYLSLKDYIAIAYRLRINQIVSPDWISTARFDIAGKLPDGAAQADVAEMLQSLLG